MRYEDVFRAVNQGEPATSPDVSKAGDGAQAVDQYGIPSMDASDFLGLLMTECDGEADAHVGGHSSQQGGQILAGTNSALLLAMLIWDTLPSNQRERIKRLVGNLASSECPIPEAVQLDNALNRVEARPSAFIESKAARPPLIWNLGEGFRGSPVVSGRKPQFEQGGW